MNAHRVSRWCCAALIACVGLAGAAQAADEHDPATLERHRRHPGRQRAAHSAPASTLVERLQPMPPVVLEYLLADSALNGFPTTARAHALNAPERAVVRSTLAGLPAEIRTLAERYIAAMYVVDNLGSSAWTEYLDPPERQSFMVFDASVLRERPNAWATRKERSGFVDAAELRLEIAEEQDDIPGGAFRFIFLHELGHSIGYGRRLLPTWIDHAGEDFPYTTLLRGQAPYTPGVAFYASPEKRLGALRARQIYERLNASPAPTLYATVCLEDDFAESFASYVHAHLLRQPYRLFVGSARYENGILQPRCAPKREFMAKLFER